MLNPRTPALNSQFGCTSRWLSSRSTGISGITLESSMECLQWLLWKQRLQFPAGGPYCYKVQGQIHHTVNLAAMVDHNRNERPKYGQLFIVDTNDAIEGRFAHPASASCNRNLAAELEALLRNVNPYVQAYQMMFEVEQEFVDANDGAVPRIRLLFNTEAPD
ncbi:hypothetical protein L596_029005 [Steinernema carpocapsae]|uniref:Uncharacterized protein n=1 Tax=Steinernema carpocapsae TaxID=34508 RepID=A0A4V5ZXC5_STECR|nr:hypothetical protein L596_029005 [Steinernema carpocapsae]